MKIRRYQILIAFIALTVLLTVVVQVLLNIQHFRYNRSQFDKQLQLALDNAFDGYYSEISKASNFAFLGKQTQIDSFFIKTNFDIKGKFFKNLDNQIDSLNRSKPDSNHVSVEVFRGKEADSAFNLRKAQQFFISINIDTFKIDLLYNYVIKAIPEADSSSIFIRHIFKDTVWYPAPLDNHEGYFRKTAQSGYLKRGEVVELYYPDSPAQILKSSLGTLLLSVLVTFLISGSLLLLLNIIRKQKLASEIKNDLISNLTHEFKTPIATVSAALESFDKFSAGNNPEKSAQYLDMSRKQLEKLSGMVERLLETATLNTSQIVLQETETDWVPIVQGVTKKFQMRFPEKHLNVRTSPNAVVKKTDVFHFENILSNLIDNAVKYGGSEIEVTLVERPTEILLSVSDNGIGVPKKYRKELFEKFFRVPSGQRHEVKGFGIGLYYVKTLVEKMGGTISFEADAKWPSQFIIRFKK